MEKLMPDNKEEFTPLRKFNFQEFFKKAPEDNLREAGKAYLHTAIKLYIKVEARVSIWNRALFGDSANIVCSLNRGIEHLLKLRLLKIDPLLLYPLPKSIEEYCHLKQIVTRNEKGIEKRIKEREILAHTISFKEALNRVALTQEGTNFDFKCFNRIYALRNSLEHHWDRNEEFLQSVVGMMSKTIISCLKEYIKDVLKEDPNKFFINTLLEEVERLDRAIENGHSLDLQRRYEQHMSVYNKNPEACPKMFFCPEKYNNLAEEETEIECPICKDKFIALWDWEADYDVEGEHGFVSGAFPDAKCLFCFNCHFYVDGPDLGTYLPDGLKIDIEPEYDEY
jgi:hypothetical protein